MSSKRKRKPRELHLSPVEWLKLMRACKAHSPSLRLRVEAERAMVSTYGENDWRLLSHQRTHKLLAAVPGAGVERATVCDQ